MNGFGITVSAPSFTTHLAAGSSAGQRSPQRTRRLQAAACAAVVRAPVASAAKHDDIPEWRTTCSIRGCRSARAGCAHARGGKGCIAAGTATGSAAPHLPVGAWFVSSGEGATFVSSARANVLCSSNHACAACACQIFWRGSRAGVVERHFFLGRDELMCWSMRTAWLNVANLRRAAVT